MTRHEHAASETQTVITRNSYQWWLNPGYGIPEYGEPGPEEREVSRSSNEYHANQHGIDWLATATLDLERKKQQKAQARLRETTAAQTTEVPEEEEPEEPGIPDPRGPRIADAMPSLFGLSGETWDGWRTFIKTLYGVPLTEGELAVLNRPGFPGDSNS